MSDWISLDELAHSHAPESKKSLWLADFLRSCKELEISVNLEINTNKMSKHLVTGSSGYVGSFIVRKLVELGESVICLDLLPPHQKINGDVTTMIPITSTSNRFQKGRVSCHSL